MADPQTSPEGTPAPPAAEAPHPRTVSPVLARVNAREGIGWILTLLGAFLVWIIIGIVDNVPSARGRGMVLVWSAILTAGSILLAWGMSRNLARAGETGRRGPPVA